MPESSVWNAEENLVPMFGNDHLLWLLESYLEDQKRKPEDEADDAPGKGIKVLIEESSDRILGAHLFGPNAEEVINLFALAIRSDLRAADLRHMIYAYPTNSSDISYML